MNALTRRGNAALFALCALMVAGLGSAQAVIDVSAVTGGIGEVGVALLAIVGAFLAVSVLILGISKVYGFVKRKAGA